MFKKSIVSIAIFFITFILVYLALDYIKINKSQSSSISPEISIHSTSLNKKSLGKVVAASCEYGVHGSADEFSACTATINCPGGYNVQTPGTNQCGGACSPTPITETAMCREYTETWSLWGPGSEFDVRLKTCDICPGGFTYSPVGTAYSSGSLLVQDGLCTKNESGFCQAEGLCLAGITPQVRYLNNSFLLNNLYVYLNAQSPTPSYQTGTCPSPLPATHQKICEIVRTSSDNSNNGSWSENYNTNKTSWNNQAAKTFPYNESLRVRCGYLRLSNNTYDNMSDYVQAEARVAHPNYAQPCQNTNACNVVSTGTYDINGICNATINTPAPCSVQNVCGQTFAGNLCPTGCTLITPSENINNSCLRDFIATTDMINPNGSVEFTWMANNSSSIPSCSFVDLTSPNPRPIPGLQNMDPAKDRARITNIQQSTRFCLVCKFYNLIDGSLIGEAAAHQWIRVIRIGEN